MTDDPAETLRRITAAVRARAELDRASGIEHTRGASPLGRATAQATVRAVPSPAPIRDLAVAGGSNPPAADEPARSGAPTQPTTAAASIAPRVSLPLAERTRVLAAGAAEVSTCRRCRLAEGRTRTVYGVGNPEARLAFVGEGPGYEEDRKGEPFVGAAGQLLNRMIAAMGLARADVYICNTVKCRPPENRTPEPDELEACAPYLERQLDVVSPEVIVALGRPAAMRLLGTGEAMNRLRGRFHTYRGIPVMPTYHPAYLLRTPSAKRVVWDDLQLVMERLGLPRA